MKPLPKKLIAAYVWNKFVSSQMSQAVIDQTTVMFDVNGHFFKANGSIIKFPGFRTVYLEEAAEKAARKSEEDDEEDIKASSTLLRLEAIGIARASFIK